MLSGLHPAQQLNGRMRFASGCGGCPPHTVLVVSQTINVYQWLSARRFKCAVTGVPTSGRCSLILSNVAQLGGHMQMFTFLMQPHIAVRFILAELDTMPAVGRLEARKAARASQLLHLKETLERAC